MEVAAVAMLEVAMVQVAAVQVAEVPQVAEVAEVAVLEAMTRVVEHVGKPPESDAKAVATSRLSPFVVLQPEHTYLVNSSELPGLLV